MDRTVRLTLGILVAATLVSPGALAGADVDGVVVVARVEDHRTEPCETGACLVTTEGDSAGSTTVDAAQRLRYAGVAFHGERVGNWTGGVILLPDASVSQNGSDVYLPHPFFQTATRLWRSVEDHQPAPGTAGLEMNEHHFAAYYYGPAWHDPHGHGKRMYGATYGTPYNYDRLGPFNVRRGSDTDHLATEEWDDAACEINVANEKCDEIHASTIGPYESATPNVVYGLEFYETEVAAHEDALGRAAANATTPATDPPSRLGFAAADLALEDPRRSPPGAPVLPLADARPRPTGPLPADPDARPLPPPDHATQDTVVQVSHPDSDLVEMGTLALAAGALLALLAFSLYSRITTPKALLQSEPRRLLYEIVQASPGICLTEATRPLGLTRNAVAHHVRMMQRARLLEVVEEDGRKLLFPAGLRPHHPCDVSHSLWSHPVRGRMVRLLMERGGAIPRHELHADLRDVPERTRNYSLARLVEKGVLTVEPDETGAAIVRLAHGAADAAAFGRELAGSRVSSGA